MGNVEFLVRTTDTPRLNFGIVEMAPGGGMDQHVHEDDSFYILDGEITFFGEERALTPPGTFLLVSPGRHPTVSRTKDACRRVCSTSTRPPASTGA